MKTNRFFKLAYYLRFALALVAIAAFAQSALAGSIERLIYYDASGTVSNFISQPTFPNSPSFEEQLDDFYPYSPNFGLQSKGDGSYYPKLFGSYTRGYLEAPTNGNYRFFIASYNDSQLWLSTNLTVAGKRLIAYETNQGAALFTGARLSTRESTNITLVGGQKYYLEVLHQGNSASNSFVKVGWQRPDGVQEIIPTLHLAQYEYNPFVGTYSVPVLNSYGYNGGDLPANITTNEGSELILQSDVLAAQPTTFRWYRNSVLLTNQNLSYLDLAPVFAADNNAAYKFVVANSYGSLTSSVVTLTITPDTNPPAVLLVDTRGNPNGVRVTFSKTISLATATNLANYALQIQGGSSLVVTSATLLADQKSVQLAGSFNFQLGATYQLTLSGIQDQSTSANNLSPNPTISLFVYAPSSGATYTFNDGTSTGFSLFGSATVAGSGSYDGSGYLDLTDAGQYQSGYVLFNSVNTVEQFHLKFKTRISDASATPGDGFSVNLAADLPNKTFLNEQQGYSPISSPGASRLSVAFNNDRLVNGVVIPAITVTWQGIAITNVLTGSAGIPSINSGDGHWANVDLQLQRGGSLSLSYDGVVVFTNLPTGFVPVAGAQLGIAAQTGANYETHWYDDLYINYNDGDVGSVAFASNPSLTNITVFENQTATFSVIPTGASPDTYQWYYNGLPISGATSSYYSVVGLVGTNTTAGTYYVAVANEFSQSNSATATLTVVADTTPLQLLATRVLAFGNNQVVLTFNKPVSLATATNLATYNLGFLTLFSAALSGDGLSVTLTTGTQERNQLYLFSISGLKDTTAAANTLNTTASFVAASASGVADYPSQIITDGSVRYWRFDEAAGGTSVASITTGVDPIAAGRVPFLGSPTLGVPSLIPSAPQDTGLGFSAATGDYLVVPNGSDINASSSPIPKKTTEFWFNASALPAPGATGLSSAQTIFEEGAASRGQAFYLWRDPANPDPNTATLVFHAWNNPNDGAGSPWGANAIVPPTTTPIYASATIQAGQTYHVVGVFDGDPAGTTGHLILYLNGVPVSTVGGVGQLYAHTSDIEIGRGATLLHTGDNGTTAKFSGVLDDLSLYNVALSPSTVALHYQAGTNTASLAITNIAPLAVTRLDTLGNPNSLVLTFNGQITPNSATNLSNYTLKNWAGSTIPISNVSLLGGSKSVQFTGSLGLLVNSNYTLAVSSIVGQSSPTNVLTPSPTNVAFVFAAPAGITYTVTNGLPVGVKVAGNAYVTNSGGITGNGFIDLTDATTNENGVVLFADRHDVTQAHVHFKARLSDASAVPGAGFSVNLAADLPTGTLGTPESGYTPAAATNRLSIAFNNRSNTPPSISVVWFGTNVIKVLAGTNGIPKLNNPDGHWADVDVAVQLNGSVSVSYDGVNVISNLATGFSPIIGAQVSLAARTTATNSETHWFDSVYLNFAEGSIGPVTIPLSGQPQNVIGLENSKVTLSVAPTGAAPFGYQWYFTNAPIAGATNRTLTITDRTNTVGAYYVRVFNSFSAATSQVAAVSIQFDQNPPAVTSIAAYAGGVNQVQIGFNKLLDPASATSLLTYALNTATITNVTLDSSGQLVTLFTTQLQNLRTNRLTIAGLLDFAAVPHALNTNVTVVSGISYYQETLVDGPVRYYRFDETNGAVANSDVAVLDPLSTAQGTLFNNPVLGASPLFTNSPGKAIQFNHANTNYITFTAQEYDITWTNTGAPKYWDKKTVEFWFKANSLPYAENYTDTNGSPAVTYHAYGLWSEGASARYFDVYLYGTNTDTTNPAEAYLYVNGGNIANDGPGAYQQWGTLAGGPAFAVYAKALVTTGQVYHVVAQLNGSADTNPASLGNPTGNIILYTNGVLADVSDWENGNPAGLLYGHSGTTIRIGQGASNFRHDGSTFAPADTFDGVIDDLTYYNSLISSNRITAHYQAALTPPLSAPTNVVNTNPPVFGGLTFTGGLLNIAWTNANAQLQRSTNVNGPFITISNAASPYHESATNARAFFRLVQ